jgi:flavin reductase (DIM6/NTAB) family NADH-FMN oxidoreductase RutF
MPVKSGEPIGPFPPGADPVEYDKLRRRVLWRFPSGLYVIGSRSSSGDVRNLMTANLVTQVSFEPKLVGVSIESEALTHSLVSSGGVFTVNVLSREDRAIVRKFTKPVSPGPGADELNGFPVRASAVTGTPVLVQAVAFVDCRVWQAVPCGSSTFFIGEVVDAGFQVADEDTPVLRMEDTRMNYGG